MMRNAIIVAAIAMLAGLAAIARADYVVRDGLGNLLTIKSFNCASAVCPMQVITDVNGTPVGSVGNPLFVSFPSQQLVSVSTSSPGITPVVSPAAEATRVLKSSQGSLWAAYATNLTSTSGFLAILNATASPGDGPMTPLDCAPLPANGVASITYGSGPPAAYSQGIVAVVTSSVTCFTKTTGTITAFIKGAVQ